MIMNSTKKNKTEVADPVNTKIQRQFNLVFNEDGKSKSPNEKTDIDTDNPFLNNMNMDEDATRAIGGNSTSEESAVATISLDLANDSDIPENTETDAGTIVASNDGLDFNLDFDMETAGEATMIAPKAEMPAKSGEETSGGFVLDELDLAMNLSENTQKTVIINLDKLKAGENGFSLENSNSSMDLMSTEEAQANIESTIKDILRPSKEELSSPDASAVSVTLNFNDDQTELNFTDNSSEDKTMIGSLPEGGLELGAPASEEGFSLNELNISDDGFSLEGGATSITSTATSDVSSDTNFFDVSTMENEEFSAIVNDVIPEKPAMDSMDFQDSSEDSFADAFSMPDSMEETFSAKKNVESVDSFSDALSDESMDSLFDDAPSFKSKAATPPPVKSAPVKSSAPEGMSSGSLNTEDSIRFQATIRALREEREELLAKIKTFKNESRELEEDNLTLKANLDEAKIEITILRKRHMVELEDLKYRLTMSEEKKALAEERARQADVRKEKLEQKVRIDFNQVKQREKELESKLELLSMDVDSQVQSRDQKILELRRKIDALEFNMENASIKEQKSHEDKRKLEDRLNKIMKTLRHSIKNLEEDSDHDSEDSDHQKDKN